MEFDLSAVTGFIAAHRAWTIPLVFLVAFGESIAFISLLIPGTAIIIACGALIPSGTLSAWQVIVGSALGATLGDAVSYWLGRHYGERILLLWPMRDHPETVARGQALMQRHGVLSIFIGRFFGPIRAIVPLLAGMAPMPPVAFWVANVTSAFIWAPAIMFPGAIVGWALERFDPWTLGVVGGVLALVGLVVWVVRRRRNGLRAEGRDPPPGPRPGRAGGR